MRVITIGRSKNNEYRLDSEACSSEHALLIVGRDNHFLLIDKNSSNGTRVFQNGKLESINQQILGLLDCFYIGDVELNPDKVLSSIGNSNIRRESNFTTIRDERNGELVRVPRD